MPDVVSDETGYSAEQLRRLHEEAAAVVARLERTREALEGELEIARRVLDRVKKELGSRR